MAGNRVGFRLGEVGVLDPDLNAMDRISDLIAAEVRTAPCKSLRDRMSLSEFQEALVPPHETVVNFSGAIRQRCWTVTRTDGTYRVVFLPMAGYFSLCVESDFGPLDIGVHGPAMGCFESV